MLAMKETQWEVRAQGLLGLMLETETWWEVERLFLMILDIFGCIERAKFCSEHGPGVI